MAGLFEELSQHQQLLLPHTGRHIGPTNLDIGCGTGITSLLHHQLLGTAPTLCDVGDIRDPAACSFPFVRLEGGRLPFPDGAFDSSYLQYVLHHLAAEEHVANLLAEARRVARRVIIVEEIAGARTDIARAKAFDREVNDRLHPGTRMPVYKYYSRLELEQLLKRLGQKLLFHALVSAGSAENGFLETQVFVAE